MECSEAASEPGSQRIGQTDAQILAFSSRGRTLPSCAPAGPDVAIVCRRSRCEVGTDRLNMMPQPAASTARDLPFMIFLFLVRAN